MDIESSLENVGLSRQESLVYLNTLKLGLAKASEIAQKSNIKREASYYILKSLQEKGFISEIIKSGVKCYSAIHPARILQVIEEEKQRKREAIKEIIPELKSIMNIALTRPKVEVYGGTEGLKTTASKMLEKENQTIYCYMPEKVLHFVPYFHPQFRRRRKERKVKLKIITEETEFMIKDLKEKDKEEMRETRFNDKIIKGLDSAYYILEDSIIILKANKREQIGVYIKEKSTAQLQRKIFNLLWRLARK